MGNTVTRLNIDGILYDFMDNMDTADATALASDILLGKTAYARGSKLTGNIESIPEKTYSVGTSDQIIDKGKYLSGDQIIKGLPLLVPDNIAYGINISGVIGMYTGKFLGGGFRYNAWQSYNVGDTLQVTNDYLNSISVPSSAGGSSSFSFKKECVVVIYWKGTSQGSPTTLKLDGVLVQSGTHYKVNAGSTISIYIGPFGGSLASIFFSIYKV